MVSFEALSFYFSRPLACSVKSLNSLIFAERETAMKRLRQDSETAQACYDSCLDRT